MENVVLILHLILALLLIVAVLLQRSEGGALGIGGGGGGGGGVMSGRGAATALQKATWGLAVAFVFTSLTLTLFAASASRDDSVTEGLDPATIESPIDDSSGIPTLDPDSVLSIPATPAEEDGAAGDAPPSIVD